MKNLTEKIPWQFTHRLGLCDKISITTCAALYERSTADREERD